MLKGILFDLDGTLIDSLSLTFDGFNHALEAIGEKRRTPPEIMAHFGAGEGPIFVKLVGPARAEAAYPVYRRYVDENLGRAPLHRGALALLDQVRDAKVPTAIVTGRGWETTQTILNHHGLMNRFVTVVADDHVTASKPAPEGILLALGRMGLTAAEAMYVGDTPSDLLAARRAGTRGVAALWDLLVDREAIEAQRPHHQAAEPAGVWEYFVSENR
jgi:HAD superfamily hydrolase (TIGR01509 family)